MLSDEAIEYVPIRERLRLAALESYKILDSDPELEFDKFVGEVSVRLQCPISLISLIDGNRQWFKACVGIRVRETARCLSFCTKAIETNEPFIVLDACTDPRFMQNPLVVGYPYIRFYVGAPLITPLGLRIGTLNAISSHQRTEVSAENLSWLQSKAADVMKIMEARRSADVRTRALKGLS